MTKNNLLKMSWKDIINKFGWGLETDEAYIIMEDGASVSDQMELVLLIDKLNKKEASREEVIDFLDKNSQSFSKTRYIMLVHVKLDEEVNGEAAQYYTMNERRLKKEKLSKTIEIMEGICKTNDNELIAIIDTSRERMNATILDAWTLLAMEKGNKNQKIMQRMKNRKDLKSDLEKSGFSIEDMISIYTDNVMVNVDMSSNAITLMERAALYNATGEYSDSWTSKDFADKKEEAGSRYIKELAEIIEENADRFNLESLILNGLQARLIAIEHEEMDIEEQERLVEEVERLFKFGQAHFQKGKASNDSVINTFKDLKRKYDGRVYNGKFYTHRNIDEIREGLENGEYVLTDFNNKQSITNLIGTVTPELLLKNLGNFSYAHTKHLLANTLYEMIYGVGNCNTDVIIYGMDKGLISKEEVIDLFMQKKISIEQIREMEDKLQANFISLEDVVGKYYEEWEQDHEEGYKYKADFEKYCQYARTLEEPGFENEAVESALIEMDSQDIEIAMLQFYKNHLLDAKTIIENTNEDEYSMIIKVIRGNDVRTLYDNKIISFEHIKKAVSEMPPDKAVHFICNVFPGDEYENECEELLQTISVENSDKSRELGTKRKKGEGTGTEKKRFGVKAIIQKAKFYESLDPEYSSELLKNGYMVCEFPNIKYKGTNDSWVVIEPMFDKSHTSDKIVPSHDKSMWILPQSLWNKERKNLVKSGKLQANYLLDLYDIMGKERITRMMHSISRKDNIEKKEADINAGKKVGSAGWPFRVMGLAKTGSQYTEEDLEQISKLALELEKSMIRE